MDNQGTLFSDREIFQKERPVKLTEKQYDDLMNTMAQEIRDNEWSDDDLEVIATDLRRLSRFSNGYQLARQLDTFNCLGNYDIDAEFVEWLDLYQSRIEELLDQNVEQWISAHDIKPKFAVGDELINKGNRVVYVNYIDMKTARYGISSQKGARRNTLMNWEDIEAYYKPNNCQIDGLKD